MVYAFPPASSSEARGEAASSKLKFKYWTGIDLGNCAFTGEEFIVTSEKQSLILTKLTGDDNSYDFCHYDFLVDYKDE